MTLIELLVVIVIIGVLSTIVAVNVLPAGEQARQRTTETQIDMIRSAMQQYRLDLGTYPSQDQGLEALIRAPQGLTRGERYRPGGYLDGTRVPEDPWGNPYQYIIPGENGVPFEIYSFGPDGRAGGGDDISSLR
ncbi:type II secretion system protein G [Parvularcula bermudensis HTCC2503]|uniref:Type II secretion system protein G n=1 Tax=Parvularcula bermudensis (strain ATCC BAA-594 / HTCC2503 / KCTC 12087) TaxID=314260 RepID=E0TBQ3_PARBH|nr:type II secretion system protein G [Parvularcula bermudensis HTCC2503]